MPKNQPDFDMDDSDFDDFDDEDFDDDEEDEGIKQSEETTDATDSKPKISRHFLQLKERLGLDSLKSSISSAKEEKVSEPSGSGPVVVVYNDPRKRKKQKKQPEKAVTKTEKYSRPEFNITKAKYEVRKLAISALRKGNKQEAQAQLAISLGAIAPKAKPVNYKVLKQMRMKEKEEVEKMKQNEQIFTARVNQMAKKKAPKNKNKVTNFDANFGKRNGKVTKGKDNSKSKGRK